MNHKHLNLLVPQWQGSGQDLSIFEGAFAIKETYLSDAKIAQVSIGTQPISTLKNDILGYDDILDQLKRINEKIEEICPETIFTIGGGCDADIGAIAYLNKAAKGNMALLYIDAHGDLNTPEASGSKLFFGMSLRALMGDCDKEILSNLSTELSGEQLVMCGNRALDAEEERYIADHSILSLSVQDIEEDFQLAAKKLKEKGYESVYVHIDLDAIDPEEFPFAPVPEANGLKVKTFIKMLQAVSEQCNIIGLGLLEYSGTTESPRTAILEEIVKIGLTL